MMVTKLCISHTYITYHIHHHIYITPVYFPTYHSDLRYILDLVTGSWSSGANQYGRTPSSLSSSSLPERYKLYIIQSFLQSSSSLLGTDTVPPYCTIKLFLLTPAHFEDQQFCVLCGATFDSKKYMEKLNNAQP